jgi:PPE-repeat protein
MIFSMFPPEYNSALMFSGAGSGPLLSAASAWDELAGDLESTATQYQTAITNLTTGPWLGPSSAQMASAAEPYIAWLQSSSAQAAATGAQAKAAAAAYQTAYSSMVPLPEIEANRALLAQLVSNNFLGQNTGAIATTEANYLEMWIQDALGMDTYHVASTAASTLTQPTPAPAVSDGGASANAAAAAQSVANSASSTASALAAADSTTDPSLGAALTELIQALFSGGTDGSITTGLTDVLTAVTADPSAALLPVQEAYYGGMMASMPARMFMSGGSSGASAASNTLASMGDQLVGNISKLVDGKLASVMGGVGGQLRSWGSSISASLASAQHLGGLSVPHGWGAAAPTDMVRAAPTLPTTSVAAPSMMHGLPSSPFSQGLMGALAGRGMTSMGSRVAAKVMPRSPAGG